MASLLWTLRAIARESERGKNKRVGDGGAEMNPSIKQGVLYIQYGSELLGVWPKNNVFLATGVPLARWEAGTAMQGRGDG